MDVVLISPYSDISALGLRMVSAVLKRAGHHVRMVFLPYQFPEIEYRRDFMCRYSDAVLDQVTGLCRGAGLIGISLFAPGLRAGNDASVEDYLDAMEHVIALVGEDHVGLGCDFSLDHPRPGPYQNYASRDKGYARNLTEFATAKINKPRGIARVHEIPNITAAMVRRGWGEETMLKLLGGNWLRLLERVWG